MIKLFWVSSLMVTLLLSGTSYASTPTATSTSKAAKAGALKTNMRKIWEDHVVWTRNVIFCLVDDLPGKDQAVNRLMQNQKDIGNAFKPYYGENAGNRLTELLYTHVNVSAEVVTASMSVFATPITESTKRWYGNADAISVFLCNLNPNWDLDDMKKMMHEHLQLTKEEAMNRINKDYVADVRTYDKVHEEILKMADMFTVGIIRQFPKKFKSGAV